MQRAVKEEVISKIKEKTLAMFDEKLMGHYVPLQGTKVNQEERLDLAERIKQVFEDEQAEVVVLLGDSGAGKSWFGQYFAWQQYQQEESERLVLWIPLLSIRDSSKHLLEDHLRDNLGLGNKKVEELQNNKTPLLIILDGYDELNTQDNLFETNDWANWGGGHRIQVLITCRKETLGGDIRGHEQRFWGSQRKIAAYEAVAFDENQIALAVQYYVTHNEVAWSTEAYLAKLKVIPELKVFLQRPILLRLVLEALPAIVAEVEGYVDREKEKKKKKGEDNIVITSKYIQLTRQKLYSIAMRQWFSRQAEKLREQGIKDELEASIEEILEKFTRDLALAFFQHRCNVLEWIPEKKEKQPAWSSLSSNRERREDSNPAWAKVFFDKEENPAIDWLLRGCPLHTVGTHRYAFLHKSLLEFFAAEHLFNSALIDGWVMAGCNLSGGNLQDEPQVLAFLADRVKVDKEFEQILFNIIETSKYEPSAWIAAANAITILNRAKINFSGCNFRRVRLGGIEQYACILMLDDGALKPAKLDRKTLALQKSNDYLTVYWVKNSEVFEKSLKKIYVEDIFKELSDVGKISTNKNLIDDITSRYGCTQGWGADLSYALLEGTDLREADLRYVNLSRACLESINLSGACMDGVSFGEWAYLQGEVFAYSADGNLLAVVSEEKNNWRITIYEGEEQRILKTWQIKRLKKKAEGVTGLSPCLAFSPNGKQLALWRDAGFKFRSKDHKISLWDIKSGRCEATLEGHIDRINNIIYRPDGKQLASGSEDRTIRLWDIESGRCEAVLEGLVRSIAYRPDGKQLASGSADKAIRLWDVESGRCEAVLEEHMDSIISKADSPNREQLASEIEDNAMRRRLCEANSNSRVEALLAEMCKGEINDVAYRPDGKQLASGYGGRDNDSTIRLWDVESGRCEAILEGHTGGVTSIVYRHDGKQLASGSGDQTVRLWDVESGCCEATLEGHTGGVNRVAYRPDGKQLISGSAGIIRLWKVEKDCYEVILEGHKHWVTSVAYHPDGKQLASGSFDKEIRLWEAESGRYEATLERYSGSVVTYRPDGKQLASGSNELVCLWEVESGHCTTILEGHTQGVSGVTYRPDSKQLASGSWDKTIRLWYGESGHCAAILEGHKDGVNSVTYRPDGKQLASGSGDKTVRLWDVESGRCEMVLKGHTKTVTSVSYRFDGKQLASGSGDKTLRLWEVEGGKCQAILKGHTHGVSCLAYRPLASLLAAGDWCGSLILWDTKRFKQLGSWPKRHASSLDRLAWSPKGDYVVTGGNDMAVRLWGLRQEDKLFHVFLCWQKAPYTHLSSFDLNLTQVTGLSPANLALLQQRGSVSGELSQRESIKFLEERNAQIYIPTGRLDQPWLDNPQQGSFVITPKNWVLALVRKKTAGHGASASVGGPGQHVWLVVQGITDDHYSVIKEVHFFLDSNKPTKYHNSIGTGLIQIRDKSPFDLERQMHEGELTAKVWSVSCDKVINELLPAIEYDQARDIGYLVTGKSAPLLFKAEAYSCLSWCVKQLQDMGLTVEPQSGWFNCIFAVPSHYLPTVEADIDKKGKRKKTKKGKEKEKEQGKEKEQDVEPDTKCRLM